MISTCLNGQTGPQRFYPGFGGQGSALVRLQSSDRLAGSRAARSVRHHHRLAVAALRGAAARHRAAPPRAHRSGPAHRPVAGRGRHRLPQRVHRHLHRERRRSSAALGNRSRHAAPHGVFRCADEDGRERWIAIAVHDDDDWQRLVQALGAPGTGRATRRSRPPPGAWRASTTLEAPARRVDAHAARRRVAGRALQAAGVDAAPVADLGDLHDDPQLAHRGHFRTVEHPVLGPHPVETHAIRFSAMEPSAAPSRATARRAHRRRAARPARHACRRDRPPARGRRSRLIVRCAVDSRSRVPLNLGVTLWRTQREAGSAAHHPRPRARHRPEARGRGA